MVRGRRLPRGFLPWLCATLGVMALITWFSSQPAVDSDQLSRGLALQLLEALGIPQARLGTANHLLRKAAHFSIYALLGLCMSGTWSFQRRLSLFPTALGCCAAFAALDEFHQSFVPGRGPQVTDVLLDSCGAAAGCVLFTLLGRRRA